MPLFEFVVFLDEVERDGESAPGRVIVPKSNVLARDEGQASILAARQIPDAEMEHLDRIVVVVRAFLSQPSKPDRVRSEDGWAVVNEPKGPRGPLGPQGPQPFAAPQGWQSSGTVFPGATWNTISHSHTPGTYTHAHALLNKAAGG